MTQSYKSGRPISRKEFLDGNPFRLKDDRGITIDIIYTFSFTKMEILEGGISTRLKVLVYSKYGFTLCTMVAHRPVRIMIKWDETEIV